MASKRNSDPDSFNKGFGKPGWIYVARNDLMREDIYKVGYTLRNPDERVKELNTEQRNKTSRIGFFNLMFAAAVLDAQGSEKALLSRLEPLRESSGKEFVNSPIELIIGEMLHILKVDNKAASATIRCIDCKAILTFCPHPMVVHKCSECGAKMTYGPRESRSAALSPSLRPKFHRIYISHLLKTGPIKRSPLGDAFFSLRNAVRQYQNGKISAKDFAMEVDHWSSYDPPLDRSPPDIPEKAPRAPKLASRPKNTKRKSTLGVDFLECQYCLSSFQVLADGEQKCPECGRTQH